MNNINSAIKPLHPTVAHQRQQLAQDKFMDEIDALCSQTDHLPPGDERDELIDRIADLNVEHQSED